MAQPELVVHTVVLPTAAEVLPEALVELMAEEAREPTLGAV